MYSVSKSFWNSFSTSTTKYACGVRGYFHDLRTSFFRFVLKHCEKLSPASIRNRFGKVMVFNHPLDVQIFNNYESVVVDNGSCNFVLKVFSLIADLAVQIRNQSTVLPSISRTSFLSGKFPLFLLKFLLRLSEKLWVLDSLAVRKNGEGFNPHINSYFFLWNRVPNRNVFHGKTDVPLGIFMFDCASFNVSNNRSMLFESQGTYFGKLQATSRDCKSGLWISEGIISALLFETWVAWFLFLLNSTEEVLKRAICSFKNVLKDLGMNGIKNFDFGLVLSQDGALLGKSKTFASSLIGVLSIEKTRIVEHPAHLKGVQECLFLFL